MKMEWISVKDRLPKDEVDVLVYNGEGFSVSCYLSKYSISYGYPVWNHNEELYNYSITHWMPLPEPPKE